MNLIEENGIERYPFGPDGLIFCKSNARRSVNDEPKISIDSNISCELLVHYGDKTKIIQVTPDIKNY